MRFRCLQNSSFVTVILFQTILLLSSLAAIAQVETSYKAVQLEYNEILFDVGKGRYEQAIRALENLIKTHPDFGNAYSKIVSLCKQNRNLSTCTFLFKKTEQQRNASPFVYFCIGLVDQELGNDLVAIENFQKAVDLGCNFPHLYWALANSYSRLNKSDEAISYFSGLLSSHEKAPFAYLSLGYLYQRSNELSAAIQNYDKATELKPDLLYAHFLRAGVYNSKNDYQLALNGFIKGLDLARNVNDLEFEQKFLGNIGAVYRNMDQYEDDIEFTEQALQISQQIGDKKYEGAWLGNLGLTHSYLAKYQESLQYHERAFRISDELSDSTTMSNHLGNMGIAFWKMGEYQNALNHYYQALDLTRKLKNKSAQMIWLGNIAIIYSQLIDFPKAIEYYGTALNLATELGDVREIGRNYGNLGNAYKNLGNYSHALINYEKALAIAKKLNIKGSKQSVLGNIADVYSELSMHSDALNHYEQALIIAQEINRKDSEARWFGNIGKVHQDIGDYDKAIEHFNEALRLNEELGVRASIGYNLLNLANAHFSLKRYDIAEKYALRALEIGQKIGEGKLEGYSLLTLGDINFKIDFNGKSIKFLRDALTIGERTGMVELSWKADVGLALTFQNQQKYGEAYNHFMNSIAKIENVRSSIKQDEFKLGFFERRMQVYDRMINLLFLMDQLHPEKGFADSTFQYAERAKARSLLDLIYEGKVFQILDDISDELRQKILANSKTLEGLRDKLSRTWTQKTNDSTQQIQQQLSQAERDRNELILELRRKHPQYHTLITPQILASRQIQKEILESHQVLVEYFVGDSATYVWVISKNRFRCKKIPISRNGLRKHISMISPLFEAHSDSLLPLVTASKEEVSSKIGAILKGPAWAHLHSSTERLHALYKLIFEEPVAEMLTQASELIIVPDDVLSYFPFELLVTAFGDKSPQYLCEKYPISYAPSASLLNPKLYQKSSQITSLLAIGNPDVKSSQPSVLSMALERFLSWFRNQYDDLPHAKEEVEGIATFYKRQLVRTGKDATEKLFKENAPRYNFLHLATHNILDDRQPMHSRILFSQSDTDTSQDGFLHTYEIFNLRLNAHMAVLSACETGLGELKRGEGIIGMNRAFLYAGVQSLVVSLWIAHDPTTSQLMRSFYSNLKAGYSKSKALQIAKLSLMRSGVDPFYWAPFILIGNPRRVQID